MEHQSLVEELIASYRNIFEDQQNAGVLDWSQHKNSNPQEIVSPTIPFVGKNYLAQKTKILLYASAENLIGYDGYLDEDEKAINRHRWFKDNKKSDFFPIVHITPISDGSLLIALKYICEQKGIIMPETPEEFIESIAFANFGKFSIQSESCNIDYAKDKSKLDCSMPYVESDLKLLQPDIIVLPETIYAKEQAAIKESKGDAEVIRLMQINARTVNCYIKPRFELKAESELSDTIRDWYDVKHFYQNKFTNKTHKNFLSVFTYLDSILK